MPRKVKGAPLDRGSNRDVDISKESDSSSLALEFAQSLNRAEIVRLMAVGQHRGEKIFYWRAYSLARKSGLPIPEAVLQYLDACAASVEIYGGSALVKAIGLAKVKGGAGAIKAAAAIDRQSVQIRVLDTELQAYLEKIPGAAKTISEARERAAKTLRQIGHVDVTADSLRKLDQNWKKSKRLERN